MKFRSITLAVAVAFSSGSYAATKLDGLLSIAVGAGTNQVLPGNGFAASQPDAVATLVRFNGGAEGLAAIRAAGGVVGSVSGDVATVTIALDKLKALAALPQVVFIEASRPATARLNEAVTAVKADTLRSGTAPNWTGATGKGVIVGVVDDGLDFRHGDFRKPDGTTRVLSLWDQRANGAAGSPPTGFDYGGECTAAMLNQAITEGVDSKACTQPSAGNHGTHVGGIVAGNGQGTGNGQAAYRFVGMAPEADIISTNSIAGGLGGGGNAVIDGVNYIKARAKALGKPVVINLSLGSYYGANDGTSNYERALSNAGEAGVILVGANGNESTDKIRAYAPIKQGETVSIGYRIPVNKPQQIEMWYPGANQWSVKVEGPNGCVTDVVPAGTPSYSANTACGRIAISNDDVNPLNDDRQVLINFGTAGTPPTQGDYKVSVTAVTGGGTVSMVGADDGNNGVFTSNTDNVTAQILTNTATATNVIAVGASVTKTNWNSLTGPSSNTSHGPIGDVANFSSRGPRRDCSNLAKCPPIMKPEITAPGAMIMSTLAQDTPRTDQSVIEADGVHIAYNGTSMATPMVSGAVALLLQKNPKLTPADVKRILFNNVQTNSFTGQLPNYNAQVPVPANANYAWGFGLLDAAKAYANTPVAGGFDVFGNPVGTNSNLRLTATIRPRAADIGKPINVYEAVLTPTGALLVNDGAGYKPFTGLPIGVYQKTTATESFDVPILSGTIDVTSLVGAVVFVGYGVTEADLLNNTQFKPVYTVK